MIVWYSTESQEERTPEAIDRTAAELQQRLAEVAPNRPVRIVPCWLTQEGEVALAIQSGLGEAELEALAKEFLGARFYSIDPLDPLSVMLGSEASGLARRVLRRAFRDGLGGYTTGPGGIEYVIVRDWLFVVFDLQDTLLDGFAVRVYGEWLPASEWWRRTWIARSLEADVDAFRSHGHSLDSFSVNELWDYIRRAGHGLVFSTTWRPLKHMLAPWKVEVAG